MKVISRRIHVLRIVDFVAFYGQPLQTTQGQVDTFDFLLLNIFGA